MLLFILCLAVAIPPGQEEAMGVFSEGDLYLVIHGRQASGIHRDSLTGIRYVSLGCAVDQEGLEFQNGWNNYMLNIWSFLGSEDTYFTLRTPEESLEYSSSSLVYRDQWGSVPIDIMPEELAHIAWLATAQIRVEADMYGELVMFSTIWGDTLHATVAISDSLTREMFSRGRLAIRMN